VSGQRQAAVVVGMHRGGTSALAGVLAILGLKPPRTPLPPAPDNPTGFFESLLVISANDYFLTKVGCRWDDCLNFNVDESYQSLASTIDPVTLELLRREFGDTGSFILKDPRLCIMLPLWRPSLERLRVDERILLIARHPGEVCRSLAARNGLSDAQAAQLWLHHFLEAEHDSRGRKRSVLIYDDLMDDWRAAIGQAAHVAGLAWPRSADDAGDEVDAFLSADIRHHAAGWSSAAVGPAQIRFLLGETWLALRQLALSPEDATALDCLDYLRDAFALWRQRIPAPV
jgi:hypothetical protein